MARPTLPLGSYGEINTWDNGAGFTARTQFRDFDGVVRLVKRNGKSKAAAERALKAALNVRQAPVLDALVAPGTKFAKVAELWFAEFARLVESGQRGSGSLDTYRSIYRVHVASALGALCIREVATPFVDRALSAIKKKSSSRARTSKIVISGVMRLAARHGAIGANPVREVGQIDSEPARPPRALTADERKQWLDAVEADPKAKRWDLPDLTQMMLATGCRIGECLAIGWTEVDLETAEVDIAWHLVRETGVGLTRKISTKSGKKGERLVRCPVGR